MNKEKKNQEPSDINSEATEEINEVAENEEDLKDKRIKELEEELKKQKDLFLRTAAEYENYRKRTEREKAMIYSDATGVAISAILPIADNLERAINIEDASAEDYQKGFEMIAKQFSDSLGKLSVESFGEKGDAFDPDIHNAVSHIEDDSMGEGVIAEVFQKGYKVNDKIIRHAMVSVAN